MPANASASGQLASPTEAATSVTAEDMGASGGSDSKGLGAGPTAGIVIALVIALLSCLVIALLVRRRRRYKEREDEETWRWFLYRGSDDDDGASTRSGRTVCCPHACFSKRFSPLSHWTTFWTFVSRIIAVV